MRLIPPDLETHLLTGTTTLCNCWKVTRRDGVISGFTDHDDDLEFDGVTYLAATGFIGSENISRVGLSVDNMEVHAALADASLTEADLANGLYDNADVEIFLVNWASPDQRLLLRRGNIGEVRRGELAFMAEIRGLAHNLQQPQGRLFQSTCDAELGDARCAVDLDHPAYTATAAVTSGAGRDDFESAALSPYASGWFQGGRVEWLTGANAGAIAEVKSHQSIGETSARIITWRPFSALPVAGDQFKITAGCDKRFETCRSKFANQVNFRGFPHIPGNDFLIAAPQRNDGKQDGSSQN